MLRIPKTITVSICCALSLGFSALTPSPLFAQDLKLADAEFTESYASNVPVSGRILVGALLVSTHTVQNFAVRLPDAAASNQVCVKVQSRDGSYSSENNYVLDGTAEGGVYTLEYPSKHTDVLNKMAPDEIAMVTTPGSCAQTQQIDQVYLSYRGTGEAGKVLILANSGRSDVFMQLQVNGGNSNQRCSTIKHGVRTGYDTLCEIDTSALESGVNKITLMRRQAGRMLPPVVFELLY